MTIASNQTNPPSALPALSGAAPWLARFTPPFEFGSFFAPEDTVLCALATRAALRRVRRAPLPHETPAGDGAERAAASPQAQRCIVELTAGSGLVLGAALLAEPALHGVAAEVDPEAVASARRNMAVLGLADRVRVERVGLFSASLPHWLRHLAPKLVACNPPYVPEPPGTPLALAAGAGPRGDRHPRGVLRAAAAAGVDRVVLSWCSLGDPVAVMRTAARAGYRLERLWVAALADGEYTGEVHAYLRTLRTSFHSESPATLAAVAGDGGARFAYLLLAGSFVRARTDNDGTARRRRGVRRVARLMHDFRRDGVVALERAHAVRKAGLRVFMVDRWDEIRLRVLAHGR